MTQMQRKPNLFFDLDGVLADFERGYTEMVGGSIKSVSEEEMWNRIIRVPNFFRNLEPMPNALRFFESYRDYRPRILTSAPKLLFDRASEQKIAWCKEHLGEDIEVIPCRGGDAKVNFMLAKGDILIDDWADNIQLWNDRGGAGVFHQTQVDTTIALSEHGIFRSLGAIEAEVDEIENHYDTLYRGMAKSAYMRERFDERKELFVEGMRFPTYASHHATLQVLGDITLAGANPEELAMAQKYLLNARSQRAMQPYSVIVREFENFKQVMSRIYTEEVDRVLSPLSSMKP